MVDAIFHLTVTIRRSLNARYSTDEEFDREIRGLSILAEDDVYSPLRDRLIDNPSLGREDCPVTGIEVHLASAIRVDDPITNAKGRKIEI